MISATAAEAALTLYSAPWQRLYVVGQLQLDAVNV